MSSHCHWKDEEKVNQDSRNEYMNTHDFSLGICHWKVDHNLSTEGSEVDEIVGKFGDLHDDQANVRSVWRQLECQRLHEGQGKIESIGDELTGKSKGVRRCDTQKGVRSKIRT